PYLSLHQPPQVRRCLHRSGGTDRTERNPSFHLFALPGRRDPSHHDDRSNGPVHLACDRPRRETEKTSRRDSQAQPVSTGHHEGRTAGHSGPSAYRGPCGCRNALQPTIRAVLISSVTIAMAFSVSASCTIFASTRASTIRAANDSLVSLLFSFICFSSPHFAKGFSSLD